MELKINGNLPKETDIDGVPAVFLMPPQQEKLEQLNITSENRVAAAPSDCYTTYQKRIRDCFAKAYKFINDHKHARTFEDLTAISIDLGKVGSETPDPLLQALLVAAFEELEREYISAGDTEYEKKKAE